MTTHIYYHADLDGHASAAITALSCKDQDNIEYYEVDYGLPVDDSKIDFSKDTIIMVDFMAPPDIMYKFFATKRFIWIDHHPTSWEWFKQSGISTDDFAGILRCGTEKSACILAWEYFMQGEPPDIIKYISLYDTWTKTDIWEDIVLPVKYYLELQETDPVNALWWWRDQIDFFMNEQQSWKQQRLNSWIEIGKKIIEYHKKQQYIQGKDKFYTAQFAGLSACLLNGTRGSSQFESLVNINDFDILVSYEQYKNDFWKIHLYSTNPNIDCGGIAKRLGSEGPIGNGGGHKGAAGFETSTKHLAKLLNWSLE